MFRLARRFFPLLIVPLFLFSAEAASKSPKYFICKVESTGAITIKTKCKKTETTITNFSDLQGDPGATGPQGEVGPSGILATGRIGLDGTKKSERLGAGVTALSVSFVSTGTYDVTLTGSFTGLAATDSTTNREKIVVMTSPVFFNFGSVAAEVNSATSSQIVIRVFLWKSDTNTVQNQNGFFFSVFQAS